MSTAKLMGLLLMALFLTICLIAAAGYWWVSNNLEHYANLYDEVVEESAGSAAEDCVAQNLQWSQTCEWSSLSCRIELRLRTQACMSVATNRDWYCKQTPVEEEILKRAYWVVESCENPEYRDYLLCSDIFEGVFEACNDEPGTP